MQNKNFQNIKITNLDNSEVEIEGEIVAEKMQDYFQKAYEKMSGETEIPGFRKGKAPKKMVIEKIGEMPIWEEASLKAVTEEYPNIIKEHKIEAIGRPEVSITKLTPGSDMGFKIKTAVVPEVDISSYKEAVKKETVKVFPDVEVTDKEVDDVLDNIKSQKEKEGTTIEINDEFAKSLGGFENLEALKKQIRENLKNEKVNKEKSTRRMAIMESILQQSNIKLPSVIVESELDKMITQFKEEISVAGMDFDDYLKKIKKTEDQIREEWRPQASKKAKVQLILNKISSEENITPDENKVNAEIEKVMKEYPGADKNQARIFVETILTNEAVFEFLEGLK